MQLELYLQRNSNALSSLMNIIISYTVSDLSLVNFKSEIRRAKSTDLASEGEGDKWPKKGIPIWGLENKNYSIFI